MATFEETRRSGRSICRIRYFGRVATDVWLRRLARRAGREPNMANQVDRAPRWQCGFGYLSGGADRRYRKTTNLRGTSQRSATLSGCPRILREGFSPPRRNGDPGRPNTWATLLLRQSRLCSRPAGVDLSNGEATDHGGPSRPRATSAVSPWLCPRRCRPRIRKTSELLNGAPPWASLLRSVAGSVFSR